MRVRQLFDKVNYHNTPRPPTLKLTQNREARIGNVSYEQLVGNCLRYFTLVDSYIIVFLLDPQHQVRVGNPCRDSYHSYEILYSSILAVWRPDVYTTSRAVFSSQGS